MKNKTAIHSFSSLTDLQKKKIDDKKVSQNKNLQKLIWLC